MTIIDVLKVFPKELFRVNNGYHVKLRQWTPQRHSFDVHVDGGLVRAKAQSPMSYQAPNGASMRPNSPYQQRLVSRSFKGRGVLVYAVPKGTLLPDDLLLVHERSDHYSLQPARAMALDDLNDKITSFLLSTATLYTRDQWLNVYPAPTDFHRMSIK